MSKTKRRMKKRHEPHELNRNLHSNFYFNSLPLLYFLSTFPVCLTEMVCTDALEGQYALRQGSVRTFCRVCPRKIHQAFYKPANTYMSSIRMEIYHG